MWFKEIIHRMRRPRAREKDERTSAPDDSKRDVALVIAAPELAAVVSELYQASGYEVFLPETPRDVFDTLVTVGDQVRVVLISSESRWATGLDKLIAEKFPRAERLVLLS